MIRSSDSESLSVSIECGSIKFITSFCRFLDYHVLSFP